MTTIARTTSQDGSHWYYNDARPCYELPKKDGSGMKVPTLADARKLNLLPSVTTILKVLHKQALVDWLIEQAVLAAMTTPRLPDEPDDAFILRVLHTERVQDQEATKARELGTDMHAGLEALFGGGQIDDELRPWIEPAYLHLKGQAQWDKIETETILVGTGYAGKADFIGWAPSGNLLADFKTTKKLPTKASWGEHRLQLSAYARADWQRSERSIITANLYISTVDCGKFAYFENPPWQEDFEQGFSPLVKHWQWSTGFTPQQ